MTDLEKQISTLKISINELQNLQYLNTETIKKLSIYNENLIKNIKAKTEELEIINKLISIKEKEGLIPNGFSYFINNEICVYRAGLEFETTLNIR